MINLQKLHDYKISFGFYAQHLSYPESDHLFDDKKLSEAFYNQLDNKIEIFSYWEQLKHQSLEELQERYINTFDFHDESTLYMTYFKFEDSKERGQMLAKLKLLYEMYGLEMPKGELSDYLPLICEFIYAADWLNDERSPKSFSMLFAVLEDGTYHLMKELENLNSPYFHLVKALRETLKACVETQEVTT
ncbi:nitrate reductase molybdenum cofactor assembly chaperone [Alkalibacillus aidingensis]|uniref:nitrate reductase molybdenum cofactor assembly chaperone n=1 Tax=Alkalibacillus aidingensis TaxID=2747607 RepID=UPI0016605B84|nr:nitrate reductase molybdenum cofactor assembly chaperone [Alkalibacillus aidingensis]